MMILAILLHAAQMQIVGRTIIMLYVSASQNIMVIHSLDAGQNVSVTQNARETWLVQITNAKILALAPAELRQFAQCSLTCQLAHAHQEQQEILSNTVILFKKSIYQMIRRILAIHRHVAATQFAGNLETQPFVNVCLDTPEDHTNAVATLNVPSIQIVHETELAKIINVLILVWEDFADIKLSAQPSITIQFAPVRTTWSAILLENVKHHLQKLSILAILIHAPKMEFVELLMELPLAPTLSVCKMRTALHRRLAMVKDVKIHASMLVESMLSVTSSITIQSALAPIDMLALHSPSAE